MSGNPLSIYVLVALGCPLGGALVTGLLGRRIGARASWPAVGAMAGAWVAAILVFAAVVRGQTLDMDLWDWFRVGEVRIAVGLMVDQLAAVMLLVVTTVGLAVHLYAMVYLRGEREGARSFALLNLLVFTALVVVLADNYALLYAGWAGGGFCTYLLIGLRREQAAAAAAARKAAVVARLGDAGFALGLLLLLVHIGTLEFAGVDEGVGILPEGVATWIGLLFFAGAAARSAQWPLHVWLADTAHSPIPAIALIHAGTTVPAGVYLLARAHPLYEASTAASQVVAVVGVATALLAGTMALTGRNLVRVLTHATASQMGFAFAALGLGARAAGVFHLGAHACFTGLLFLGAGSAVRAAANETDIWKMGGLKQRLPFTFWTVLIGALALSGVPPLVGFWSRSAILTAALDAGQLAVWIAGCAAAWLNALFVFRLVFTVFLGASRAEEGAEEGPGETPVMAIPMVFLALLCAAAGLVGYPPGSGWIDRFLQPVLGSFAAAGKGGLPHAALLAVATGVAALGVVLAWALYARAAPDPSRLDAGPWYRLLAREYYVEEFCDRALVRPWRTMAGFLRDVVDTVLIDLVCVNGAALGVRGLGWVLGRLQTGQVGVYALVAVIGAVVMLFYLLF